VIQFLSYRTQKTNINQTKAQYKLGKYSTGRLIRRTEQKILDSDPGIPPLEKTSSKSVQRYLANKK